MKSSTGPGGRRLVLWVLKIGCGLGVKRGVGETGWKGGQKSCRLGLLSHAQVLRLEQREDVEGFLSRTSVFPRMVLCFWLCPAHKPHLQSF